MLDALIGQFMSSDQGKGTLQELQGKGLSPQQSTDAVKATAEGATQVGGLDLGALAGGGSGSGKGVGGLLGSLAGGGGQSSGGGLGGLLGGGLGGGGPGASSSMLAPVAQVVAQKTGLSPQMAQTVAAVALPKVLSFIQAKGGKP